MWEVVKRVKFKKDQVVAAGSSYREAEGVYEPLAAEVNAVDGEGNYLHPSVRVSIRRESKE